MKNILRYLKVHCGEGLIIRRSKPTNSTYLYFGKHKVRLSDHMPANTYSRYIQFIEVGDGQFITHGKNRRPVIMNRVKVERTIEALYAVGIKKNDKWVLTLTKLCNTSKFKSLEGDQRNEIKSLTKTGKINAMEACSLTLKYAK